VCVPLVTSLETIVRRLVPLGSKGGPMPTFVLKTEPSTYSYADLERDRETVWDGITNNAALQHLRTMRVGDEVLFYHTGEEKAIVGLARVSSPPREDPKKPGKTPKGEPKFAVIGLKAMRTAKSPVTLEVMKADERFSEFLLVTHGRLSVLPVPAAVDSAIRKMAGL
jgi:predicted RNA-binding protein with PUA-like domain